MAFFWFKNGIEYFMMIDNFDIYNLKENIIEDNTQIISDLENTGQKKINSKHFYDDEESKLFDKITDSKKLSEKKRVEISMMIKRHSKFNIGISNNMEVDKYNVLNATIFSMKRAYSKFKNTELKIKIDGLKTFELNERTTFHIKGDQKSITIAAASIVAKVYRDNLMIKLSSAYPQYGWLRNKGYGTKEHINSIHQFGISRYHRKSFLKNLNL